MATNADSKETLTGNGAPTASTVEIKIKTLDSQTYTLRVDKYVPVPALKEQIATVTGVLSERQRLICQGKVLKDDQLLSAYHVEDGHTLHLVVRQPIASQPANSSSSSRPNFVGAENQSTFSDNSPLRGSHIGHNIVFGTVSLADQGDPSASDLGRIVSTVISSLGGNNVDGRNVSLSSRERSSDINVRTSGFSEPSDPSQSTMQESRSNQSGQRQGITQLPTSASLGNQQQPTIIPDSLATLSQYISYIKNEFNELCSSFQSGSVHEQSVSASGSNSGTSRGLPTAASLADIMLLGRQLLIDQAGGCLYELASQLQGQTSVIDPQTRANIQSNALRSGELFQNLGSVLLELGRAIMTLRMGQAPEEAVVNAGPAIFVSASRPNPIMVQAGTGLNSISAGSVQGRAPTFGSGLLSRNIDIRIRRGPPVVQAATANETEQTGMPQNSERADAPGSSLDNFVHQILQGAANGPSTSGESSVRVVPIRTVFAIPAGLAHPPSDTYASSDPLTHSLFSRLYEQFQGNQNIGNTSAADIPPTELHHDRGQNEPDIRLASESRPGSTQRDENPPATSMDVPNEDSIPNQGNFVFSSLDTQGLTGDGSNEAVEDERLHSLNPLSQVFEALRSIFPAEEVHGNESGQTTNSEGGPSSQEITDGLFFSNLLHHIMPFISQQATSQLDTELPTTTSSSEQDQSQTEADVRSRRDTSDEPASKRQRM